MAQAVSAVPMTLEPSSKGGLGLMAAVYPIQLGRSIAGRRIGIASTNAISNQ